MKNTSKTKQIISKQIKTKVTKPERKSKINMLKNITKAKMMEMAIIMLSPQTKIGAVSRPHHYQLHTVMFKNFVVSESLVFFDLKQVFLINALVGNAVNQTGKFSETREVNF